VNKLRETLRKKTSKAHAKLDASLIIYDLKTQEGLSSYLSVHYLARESLSKMSKTFSGERANIEKLKELRDDLKVLGVTPPENRLKVRSLTHPLGLTYVIAGSSLGSKLLYENWLLTDDEVVGCAGKFLTSAKDSTDWLAFLNKTDKLELSTDELDRVVATANAVFEVFEAANELVRLGLDDHTQ